MEDLSVEIISNILLRLPIKTLCGLKCVCKGWRTLISSPQFTESFQKQSNHEIQLLIRTDSLHTVSLEEVLHAPSSLTKLELLSNRNPNCFLEVVGSSNGLLCLVQHPSTFFLLNPTTRESITLCPDPGYPVKLCGSGYVTLVEDYKVIKVSSSSMVRVYSAKSNSWKLVQVDFPCNVNADLGNKHAYVNGVVYWMISAPNAPLRIAIVGFDFTEENFRKIQLPKTIQRPNRYTLVANLGVLNHDLYVSVEIYPLCFELWVMSKNGEGQSWNKIYVIPNYENDVPFRGLLPVCILRGQVLLQADNRYLFLFDPVNVKFQQLKFRLPPGPCCKFRGRVYEKEEPCCAFQAAVYEKSIVSPCGYFWLNESKVDRLRQ